MLGQCKRCKYQAGIFGLKKGLCKSCMAEEASESHNIGQGLLDRSQKWQVIGSEIAKDCYKNGLLQGEIVRLSEIISFIKQHHSYNSNVVENGFLNEMKSYTESGIVLNFCIENDDIVFVHKDHVDTLLESQSV